MPLSPITKQSSSKDKKSSLFDYIAILFEENSENWREAYPSLTLSYLMNNFYDLVGNKIPYTVFYDQWAGGLLLQKWNQYFEFLKLGRPLAYITHQAFFFETDFYVDERVLIPRFETELLLEQVMTELSALDKVGIPTIRMAEVGVGPGTLSLSLAQMSYKAELDIQAGDISKEAIQVCEHNKYRLGFKIPNKNTIELLISDRMEKMGEGFDIIFSNPPYIKREKDLSQVHHQVVKNEPDQALFLDDEIYDEWFISFFKEVNEKLKSGGLFVMEGHENHLQSLFEVAKKIITISEGSVLPDLTGRDRLLKLRKL